jgi:ferredoxin
MENYHKINIYYFSGTGNSRNVSQWIAEQASVKGIACSQYNIAQIDRLKIDIPEPGSLLIFVSPVHGFNYPPVMLNFIFRFPKANGHVALMNTRAGMLIGKFITPGLSGITFYLSALILKLKGYSIRAMVPVDMPSNWISIHPGLNKPTIEYLHQKNKERVTRFSERILNGKTQFRNLYEIGWDALISPIAVLYYFIGRFILAKSYYASSDCNNCGVCYNGCPVKAIKLVDHRPYWSFMCESCMKCMGNCPQKAIETAHGFFIGFIILFNSVILYYFYRYFSLFFFEIKSELLKFIIEPVIMIGCLQVSYHLVHYLMRFRFFERMMVYTSLTKYKFWGRRYKALKY